MISPRVPSSTYRLQFGPAFGFSEARGVVRYLDALGVGDAYTSPLLQARTGSTHGYDLVDPSRLNADLGTRREFDAFSRELRRRDMGLLLDIVPNHMAADLQNPWWTDVLRSGQGSAFAGVFDIDWELGGGKVLVPVLGGTYSQILEGGDLRLSVEDGDLWLRYFERRFPLRPESVERVRSAGRASLARGARTFTGRVGRPASFEALDELVQDQHYRLAFWRVTAEDINYRRFFDVTDLVAVRMEEREVFDAAHRHVLSLVASGAVTGLRIDHVDGLHDPVEYLERLQRAAGGSLYVVVEKILGTGEHLSPGWPVAGTTGYEFATDLGGLLVDERSRRSLDETYQRSTAILQSFADIAFEKKRMVMDELFRTELSVLVRRLHELASNDRYGRDLTSSQLWEGLTAVTAGLPVYRTYTRSPEVSSIDREHVEHAVSEARRRSAEHLPDEVFDFIRRVLLLEDAADHEQTERWLAFVMRWQQATGAITAKGVEDTAFYVYNRLVSLNEVGAEPPADESITVASFHERNASRSATTPHQLNASTTHDTKRSEDVRACIDALSELPDAWSRAVSRWSRMNAPKKRRVEGEPVPDPNEEYLLYQTLLGAWPLAEGEQRDFARRIKVYMVKAAREAKVHTTWIDQNAHYEDALQAFVGSLLGRGGAGFRSDFLRLQRRVAHLGMLNSLSGVILKVTSPGVPDFYQGTELWHLRLVDPDNREPVDFELREKLLDELDHRASGSEELASLAHDLLRDWPDGRIKLWVTSRSLRFRRDHRSLFDEGDYLPLEPNGPHSRNLVAFARHAGDQWSLTVVPRLTGSLTGARSGRMPLGPKVWGATSLTLPDAAPDAWRNVFTDELVESERPRGRRVLRLRDVFRTSPVTLLTPTG